MRRKEEEEDRVGTMRHIAVEVSTAQGSLKFPYQPDNADL
jgi:hypothetical protein